MEFYQILGFFFVYSTILFFVQYFGNASSSSHYVNSVQRRSFFWSVFSRIQFEYCKIRTRKSSVFGHFSRNAIIVFKEILVGRLMHSLIIVSFEQIWHPTMSVIGIKSYIIKKRSF